MSAGGVDTNTLKWVKSEIDETLTQAQTSLEAYVEDTADESQMRFCINYLHQVYGTLQMVEIYGAALAIEEMELLAQAIFDGTVSNKNDAYETLMRGILQVPDYLEHLLLGNPDMPVLLLPLLNDLRAARNEALLSEGALFSPDLNVNAPSIELSESGEKEGLSSLARKLRHNYHLGLLAWFQNKNPKVGLQKIADVISELYKVAESDEARRVLWVTNALLESLLNDGVATSVAVKMLIGHVDRQIKKIIDEGERVLSKQPPEVLEKNLLFYVASSSTSGVLTTEIKEAFNLREIMPDTHALEQARADLDAPNAALMETVSSVIIEDIGRIKDRLDLYVRADEKDMSVIEDVHASLVQMADTLAMLTLGVQREAVIKQVEILKAVIDGKLAAEEKELMNVATAMIVIENSLSEISSARTASKIKVKEGVAADNTALEQLQTAEQHKLLQSVLDEAKINLIKIKEALTEFSSNVEEQEKLKPIPDLLEQIHGGLLILSLPDAANLLTITNNYIRNKLIKDKISPSEDDLNNLADAISSIEYYMESLMGNWGQPEAILNVAVQSLQALGLNTTIIEDVNLASEEIAELPSDFYEAEDVITLTGGMELETERPLELKTEEPAGEIPELTSDFELEESAEIPDIVVGEELSLDELSFGLSDISEESSTELEFDGGSPNGLSLEGFNLHEEMGDSTAAGILLNENDMEGSHELEFKESRKTEDEEPVASQLIPEPVQKPVAINSPSLLDDTIDDEIIEIFLEEAEEAFENISSLLPLWKSNTKDEATVNEIRRSFHTLKGSGRLVGASDVGEFAWAYENMLTRVLEHTITVSPELLEIMERSKEALPELLKLFKSNIKPGENILQLMQYADELSQGKSITFIIPATEETDTDTVKTHDLSVESETEIIAEDEYAGLFPVEIDSILLEIYRKEVATHLQSLKQYIVNWNFGNHEPDQILLRALHTLTGSSRTTGIKSIATVCSNFENYVKNLQDNEYKFPQVALLELEATISLVENTVDCLDKPGAELPEHEILLSRIRDLPKDFNQAPLASDVKEEEVIQTDAGTSDYDVELLEIFLEEGKEILDESDQTIHDWIANPDDNTLLELLQRQLHTLKGGARMAGITELGDLGHNIESLLTAVVNGHLKSSKAMFDLVLRAQDRLVKMLDRVQKHKALIPATELIHEVELMLTSRGKADGFIATEEHIEIKPLPDVVLKNTQSEIELDTDKESLQSLDIEFTDETEKPENLKTTSDNIITLKNETFPSVEEESDRRQTPRVQAEQVRVRADLLDNLVNFAGEVSIYRSRLEQQTNNFRYNIVEFDDTVNRLRDQLRQFEIETETQIEFRQEETLSSAQEKFDPLEMDRFTTMQHLSRAMMESLGDLDSLRGIMNNLTRESETLLLQQSRVNTDLQEGLMRTRLVSFSGQAARLRRIVRQTCGELGKHADLTLHGVDSEMDRSVLDRIIPPIEHMLRNAVAHGIEVPEQRKKAGKEESGNIDFSISREGTEILIKIKDDGAGINLDAIHKKAISRGLIKDNTPVNKDRLIEMIMLSGFSTADSVNQVSGRGVGMDVVNTEIKQLGGMFNIETEKNKGTLFTVSLPMTLTITRALMVMIDEDVYAIPLLSVEGVERITARKVREIMSQQKKVYDWVGEEYNFMHLGSIMDIAELKLTDDDQQLPLMMIRSGEHRAAVLVDSLLGSREIVVKPVGPQLNTLNGISGATIMGDGSVVLIIDLGVIIRQTATSKTDENVTPVEVEAVKKEDNAPLVMVVDDSITVRKVTTRLLERHEMRVITAKDGVDALAQLLETRPDIMLLDVEMPRMDGFELATNMRNDERLKNIPIIMITSRTGQKHRDQAASIGVNIYMGKPYTESDLFDNIKVLTGHDL